MGAQPVRVKKPDPEPDVRRLREDVEALRRGLDASLSELDVRRREILDPRRHKGALAAAGIAAAVAVAAAVALTIRRRRRRHRATEKLRRLRQAVDRITRHPERVATEPPPLGPRLLQTAAVAAATTLARRIAGQALAPRPAGRRPR